MLTLHCTRKLLKHLHTVIRADSVRPTTCLGDWYAHLLFTERLRLVICVSERSLLPVFVAAKDPASFVPRFQAAVQSVLRCIGVPPESLDHEAREMAKVMTGAGANRSVLGSLNDLAFLSRAVIDEQPEIDLTMLAMEVAETPCAPLKQVWKAPVRPIAHHRQDDLRNQGEAVPGHRTTHDSVFSSPC